MPMRILSKMRKQTAVYWAPLAPDPYGQPTYADPIELRVRWDDTQEEIVTTDGTRTTATRSTVYLGQDIVLDGLLMLGDISSVVDGDVRANNPTAKVIRSFANIKTLKADDSLRVATL